MSRRNRAEVREIVADPVYGSTVVTKVINQIMVDGKKAIAEGIVYGSFDIIKEKLSVEPDKYFLQALENLKPLLETKARRVGGSNYQVPIEITPSRQQTLAIRWLVGYARKRNEKSMEEKLACEIMDAYNSTGGAFKKKEDVHKMAESNKAFAHYRW